MLLSLDDLELKGEEKEIAEQNFKKYLIEQKGIEEKREKERFESISRELTETSKRLYNQQKQYKEMLIDVQVEAMRRFKTKPSIEQIKPIKKTKNEQRDEFYSDWLEKENITSEETTKFTKIELQNILMESEKAKTGKSVLWGSGLDGWIKDTELYKGKAGRPKKQ